MKVFRILSIVLFCSPMLSAATLFDFGAAANLRWRIWAGGFADKSERAKQLSFSREGMCVKLDRMRSVKPSPWLILGLDKGQAPVLPADTRLLLSYRLPADSVVSKAYMLVVEDANGERFSYAPESIEADGDRRIAVYRIKAGAHIGAFKASKPSGGGTSGKNCNGVLDAPLRFHTISFPFHRQRTAGSVTIEKFEVEDDVALARQIVRRPLVKFCAEDEAWKMELTPLRKGEDALATANCASSPLRKGEDALATANCATSLVGRASSPCAPSARSTDCKTASLRYRSFPGLKPVPGVKSVVVKVASRLPLDGEAVMYFTNPATGERKRAKSPWRESMRFEFNLPHDTVFQFDHIDFWPKKGTPIDFEVTEITGEWEETAAEAVITRLETGNPQFLVRNESAVPCLVLENAADAPCTFTGEWRLCDFRGERSCATNKVTLAAHETKRFTVRGANARGIYRVVGTIRAEDGSTQRCEHRFAVLGQVRVEPRWPLGKHFRMGVNYHAGRYSPGDLRRTMDSLAAAGVKLVRLGGYHFNSCEPAPGVFDWTRSDRIMAEGISHGISFDAGIYPPPVWAKIPEIYERVKGQRKAQFAPSRPGLMRDYAEAVARRYGTKIDYYELGNEWDLVKPDVLPEDHAIRLHRETWEGLKKGCPEAKLIPNGWTRDMTFDRPGMNRTGFQERYMIATKGLYDFHPTHMHGTFAGFVDNVTRLMEQRRRHGITVPWYSNETAITTVNGNEEEAALTVWKKILFAWSRGSCDYIWYNLKGTGWVPSDPEQAYGLIAADYQPRATYVALAGLISVAQGLDFDATLSETSTRWLFRMKGDKGDFAGIVLAGWDSAAPKEGCLLRVRTDAGKAFKADLFGNRTECAIRGGVVAWSLGTEPAALMLEGAAKAEPDAADLANCPEPKVMSIPNLTAELRKPDFTLDSVKSVHDIYEADPSNVRRTWKGPSDLSAKIWLEKVAEGLRVKAVVTDDANAKGDDVVVLVRFTQAQEQMEVSLSSDKRVKATRKTDGVTTTYDAVLTYEAFKFKPEDLTTGIGIAVHVLEDDGDGPDGWLHTEAEGTSLRIVNFR